MSSENTLLEPMPISFMLRYQRQTIPKPLITVARTMELALAPAPAEPFVTTPRQAFAVLCKNIAEMVESRNSHLFLDLPPFRYIADKYQPQQVLDIGCGLGGYLRMFQEWGATEVLGIEESPIGDLFLSNGNYLQHDLRQPLDLQRTYDLVICVEVIERIAPQYVEIVLETIHRHAKGRILFSAAEPGQPGIGYVNCRPLSYWLEAWQRLGWEPDVFDSIAVRALSTFTWLRRNPVVLVRSDRPHTSPFATIDLARLARQPFKWYDQSPNIYTFPLSEPLPSSSVVPQ